jgi:hypothetical protein
MDSIPGQPPDSSRRCGRAGRRRILRLLLMGAASATVAAACGSVHHASAPTTSSRVAPSTTTTSTTVRPTTTTAPPPAVSPLTGVAQPNAAQLAMPAVVVKIDNVDAARPQTGLANADIVYEEEVEGGLTRLAAIFQSSYPTLVGPVRSGRLTDEGIMDDLNHPVYVFSGTNRIFLPILDSQPATPVNADNQGSLFWRVGSNAPHNVFTSVAKDATVSTTHAPPAPLWSFLHPGQPFGAGAATPAAQIAITFPAASIGWTYSAPAHAWLRTQNGTVDLDSAGHQVAAENVLLMFVSYVTSGMATGEGLPPAPIPEGIMTGSGPLWAFNGSSVVRGTWTRPSLTSHASFTTANGKAIALAPGPTWVELVPLGTLPAVVP